MSRLLLLFFWFSLFESSPAQQPAQQIDPTQLTRPTGQGSGAANTSSINEDAPNNEDAPRDEGDQSDSAEDVAAAEDAIEKGLILYADAANLQNGGALRPAIETWQRFLRDFPNHPRLSDAAHYLGVCYMQVDPPEPTSAASAFEKSISIPNETLREKSLANLGWCLYSSAIDGETDRRRLNESIDIFGKLLSEFPKSELRDRAYFYSGEAAYSLGRTDDAVKFYDQLLTLPEIADSIFRCDGYYARGVSLESISESRRAIESYRQCLDGCDSDASATIDVQSRIGDLLIGEEDYAGAIEAFDAVIAAAPADGPRDGDVAYAFYRKGYAAFASGKLGAAVEAYETLLRRFPNSDYVDPSTMSSGQAAYRDGNLELAAERFGQVVDRMDLAAATEAAHWLCRIKLADGDWKSAETVASRVIDRIAAADDDSTLGKLQFRGKLQFDLAQSVANDPDRIGESVAMFVAAAELEPQTPLAARSIYNASFSAVSAGENELAIELADRFLSNFSGQPLATDVSLIRAEALLATGQNDAAADSLLLLIESSGGPMETIASGVDRKQTESRRGAWVLRASTALSAAKRFDEAIELLSENLATLSSKQQVRATFSLGQLSEQVNAPEKAAIWFERANELQPQGDLGREAVLLASVSHEKAGHDERAEKGYRAVIDQNETSPLVDQARFKLAGMLSQRGEYLEAAELFEPVVKSSQTPTLVPYAMLGRANALSQIDRWQDATDQLTKLIDSYPGHATSARARYDRGIARSVLGESDQAKEDLNSFLATKPSDELLGETLYELALLDQADGDDASAADRLERLIDEVPWFAELNDAKYRLGWSQWKSGRMEKAKVTFGSLRDDEKLNGYGFDAAAMLGEIEFVEKDYESSLKAFEAVRSIIVERDETAANLRDKEAERIREMVLLHGGQSAAQLGKHDLAILWYDDLRERFPGTIYLPELFYELGASSREIGKEQEALKYFGEVVDNYRTEVGARSRFMRGEVYFAQRKFNDAIGEFQRLMFGFGSDAAPDDIKPWQARAGFEAGRCSELLASTAASKSAKQKAIEISLRFYRYVVDKHPGHELAIKAKQRIEALQP